MSTLTARDSDPLEQLMLLTRHADRRPGSSGNAAATDDVAAILRHLGWAASTPDFDVVCWEGGEGHVMHDGDVVRVHPSPYGTGGSCGGRLVAVETNQELEQLAAAQATGSTIVLLHGAITREPLTPTAFPFYSMEGHDRLRTLLLDAAPAAIVSITGVMPDLCGAVEPFAFIEDGDFPIPVADVSGDDADRLLTWVGRHVDVTLDARRWPGHARNVVARRVAAEPRVLVTAHLDTKPGTPGALDNAAGVVVLLQLARLLHARASVELVAFNGEDYFNAAGEVDYLRRSESAGRSLADLDLVVNIDAAGSTGDDVAWSAYNIEGPDLHRVRRDLRRSGIVPGPQWWQSDHAIFATRGCPAVAFTSAHLANVLATVVHTDADVPERVDAASLEMLARAIADLLRAWPGVCDSPAS